MKQILIAILLFGALGLTGQSGLVDKVMVVIGDKIILHSDIEEQVKYLKAQQGSVPENARCQLLDQVIVQKVFLQQAYIDSLVVSPEEVDGQLDSRVNQILSYMGGDVTQFEAYYGKSINEVKEDFRQDIEDQIIMERMQAKSVESITVTPSEVKQFYRSIPRDSLPYFGAEVEVSEVVMKPKVNKVELQKAKEKLEKIKAQIETGKDFGELAGTFSDDPGSAKQGGDLGWVKRGELVPEFEAAVFTLNPMEYSPIVQTEYGYHLIQLIERRGNAVNARHILVKPEITSADKEIVKTKLDSIRNLIVTDSISFGRAVQKYSEDETSKSNAGRLLNPQSGVSTFEVAQLPSEVFFAIDPMEVGEVTEVLEYQLQTGEMAYRLIRLDAKSQPHQANLNDDYSKIQEAALEQKKLKEMEAWVDEKVGEMYIKIAPEYKDCEDLKKWSEHSKNY